MTGKGISKIPTPNKKNLINLNNKPISDSASEAENQEPLGFDLAFDAGASTATGRSTTSTGAPSGA
jgi:hypothetical protein